MTSVLRRARPGNALIGARAIAVAGLCVLALAACREGDPDGYVSREARLREAILRFRDPDKKSFIYGCLGVPFGSSGNRAAVFGDNIHQVGISDDGTATFEVKRWLAVEGPDIVRERVTFRAKDDRVLDFAYMEVNPGLPDHCTRARTGGAAVAIPAASL